MQIAKTKWKPYMYNKYLFILHKPIENTLNPYVQVLFYDINNVFRNERSLHWGKLCCATCIFNFYHEKKRELRGKGTKPLTITFNGHNIENL